MDWAGLKQIIQAVSDHGEWEVDWRARARTELGENVFVLKQGDNPRGIFGWGRVIGSWFRDSTDTARAPVLITEILDPRKNTILGYEELHGILTQNELNTPYSGRRISREAEAAINDLWIQRNKELRESSPEYSGRNVRTNSLMRIGQAQFSATVKEGYSRRCAVCSIAIPEFLVAAHIVRWADDESIRLDPKNGICLCSLHDKAFEHGYFFIDESFQIVFNTELESDPSLQQYLHLKPGLKINVPTLHAPKLEYLDRHRKRYSRALQEQSAQKQPRTVTMIE
jgi:hypothetical protein